MKIAPILVGLLMAGVLATGLWLQWGQPRRVIGTGEVVAKSRHTPGKSLTARTRHVEIGRVRVWEVETPGGNWLDCAGDCAETLRREHLDPWETKREQGK